MYVPANFRPSSTAEMESVIRQYPFGLLITDTDHATHIPMELVYRNNVQYLEGHLSAANPHTHVLNQAKSLAVFSGPHCYISASWYEKPNVPTWNYMAVHVYGTITMQSEEEMRSALRSLVDRYEANSEKPVKVEEMPEDMMKKYLRGIVGFRMSMDRIEGKWKLSQNRDEEDYRNIIKELERVDEVNAGLIAGEMKKRSR